MTRPTDRGATRFYVGFLAVTLLVAGLLSYLASGNPDGLDSVSETGCELAEDGSVTSGTCIAQNAQEPVTAVSPLAEYAIGGDDGLVGLAGVIGALVTLLVAGGLFWMLRSPGNRSGSPPSTSRVE